LVLTTACLAVACSSYGRYTVLMSVENNTATSCSMQYQKFDGYRVYRFSVAEVRTFEAHFSTESGTLDYVVTDGSGEVVFEREDVGNVGFASSISPGQYTVRVTGHAHCGSFSFDWKEVPSAA